MYKDKYVYLGDGDPEPGLGEFEIGERPIHAPTPLRPYDGLVVDGVPYVQYALARVDKIMTGSTAPPKIAEMQHTLLVSTLFHRLNKQNVPIIPDATGDIWRLEDLAHQGIATPDDLMLLLLCGGGNVKSIELAKQTHPFDWNTEEMDKIIENCIDKHRVVTQITPSAPRYSLMLGVSPDDEAKCDLDVAGAVRKVNYSIGKLSSAAGTKELVIVRRDVVVVDVAATSTLVQTEISRWAKPLRNPGAEPIAYVGTALPDVVERALTNRLDQDAQNTVRPCVTSYYAYLADDTDAK